MPPPPTSSPSSPSLTTSNNHATSNDSVPPTPSSTRKRGRAKATDFFEADTNNTNSAVDAPNETLSNVTSSPNSSPPKKSSHRRSWTHTFKGSGLKETRLHRREPSSPSITSALAVPTSPALNTRRSKKLDLDLFKLDDVQPSPARKRTARKAPKPVPESVAEEEEEEEQEDPLNQNEEEENEEEKEPTSRGLFATEEPEDDEDDHQPMESDDHPQQAEADDEDDDDNDNDSDGDEDDEPMNEVDTALFNGEGIPAKKQSKQTDSILPKTTPSKSLTPVSSKKSTKRKLASSDDDDDDDDSASRSLKSSLLQPFDEAAEAAKREAALKAAAEQRQKEAEAKRRAAYGEDEDEDEDEDADDDDEPPQEEVSFKAAKRAIEAQSRAEEAAAERVAAAKASKAAAQSAARTKQSALSRAAQLKSSLTGSSATLNLSAADNFNPDGTLSVAFLDQLAKAESEAKQRAKEEAEYAKAREEEDRQAELAAEKQRQRAKKQKLAAVKQAGRFTLVVANSPNSSSHPVEPSTVANGSARTVGSNKSAYTSQLAYAPITNSAILNFRTQHLYNNGMIQRQDLKHNQSKVNLTQVKKQAKFGLTPTQLQHKQQLFKGGR